MIEGGRRGDGKIISPVSVKFRIYPVQGKGHNGEDVGANGIFRPGGIDFAGGYIFDIVPVTDIIIFGSGVSGRTVMDHNIFGDDHTA